MEIGGALKCEVKEAFGWPAHDRDRPGNRRVSLELFEYAGLQGKNELLKRSNQTTGRAQNMIVDRSILIACVVGVSFFFIFFWGAVRLGREKS